MQKIIVFSGLPGSGKSTLAEKVASKLQTPIFSVDPIESSIIKSGIEKSFETGLGAYLVAQTLAEEQLKLGMSVVIDAVNSLKEARDMWHELSKKFGVKLFIIECVLGENTHKERLGKRMRNLHGIPEVTWEDVERRKKEYLPWTEERLVVDTAKDVENLVEQILKYIE